MVDTLRVLLLRNDRRRRALPLLSLAFALSGILLLALAARAPAGPSAAAPAPPAQAELPLEPATAISHAESATATPAPPATAARAVIPTRPPAPIAAPVLVPVVAPIAAPASGVRLAFVGDVMLGRNIAPVRRARGNAYPFAQVAPLLRSADLAFANLESPLTRQTYFRGGYNLRAEPEAAEALALAGFDWVSVANNHSGDHGRAGLAETLASLRGRAIAYAGGGNSESEARRPAVKIVGGLRMALLAYDALHATITASGDQAGSRWFDAQSAAADIRRARAEGAHVVIVSVHWGVEYQPSATAAQKQAARQLAAAGADLIIGHHPHVVEPLEWLSQPNGRPSIVAYSLGNFLFDQWFSDAVREGVILQVTVDKDGVAAVNLVPTRNLAGQVQVQPAAAAAGALKRLLPPGAVPAPWQRAATTDAQNRIWYRRP